MIVSLDIEWYGRVLNISDNIHENIFRIGWPGIKGDCTALNSRYPGLWIDNNHDAFHVGISQPGDCGKGWQLVTYPITTFTIYHVHIEFTDTLIYIAINDTEVVNEARGSTLPSYIGQLLNVYIATDYWNNPSVIANVSILNMNIISIPPTPSPTLNTNTPTYNPTNNPTKNTDTPTYIPTSNPTYIPTTTPTYIPTTTPTYIPTTNPTSIPSVNPTTTPTYTPTNIPTINPTTTPSITPTSNPSVNPTSLAPTLHPTSNPTTNPSIFPTNHPITSVPTYNPTYIPTYIPTSTPTFNPTFIPTYIPTSIPTSTPTYNPTYIPTSTPTYNPTVIPTYTPTNTPILNPTTSTPTYIPTDNPTDNPSHIPTSHPTIIPTNIPTNNPITTSPTTTQPTIRSPTIIPISINPTTINPTITPTYIPSIIPSINPSINPSITPTNTPITFKTTDTIGGNAKKEENSGFALEELLFILIAMIAGCILCTLMIVIIIRNSKRVGTRKENEKSSSILSNDHLPSPSPNEPYEYKVKGHKYLEKKPSEIIGGHININNQLTDNELMEIENGKNNTEHTEIESENETEYKSETTYEYKGNNNYIHTNTQNQIDSEMEMEMEIENENGMEIIETETISSHKHRYLMSAISEENYIKNMITQAVIIKTNSSNTIDTNNSNANVELIEIIDENDSAICDNDTIKNLPILPIPSQTINKSNKSINTFGSLEIDEESITMLEVGYEWITLVLLEIDNLNWRYYVDNFKKHQVTENRLIDLDKDDLKVLIPHKITRNKFEKLLENKLNMYHE